MEVYHKELNTWWNTPRTPVQIKTSEPTPTTTSSLGGRLFRPEFFEAEVWQAERLGRLHGQTDRQFEDLNNGDPFPAKFDRRHDKSVVMDWTPSERWNLSAAFVYATGNTLTLPIQRYLEGNITDVYGSRNGYRMVPYHRADISATCSPKELRRPESGAPWVFSIYNLYNRANPYFLFFDNEGELLEGNLEIQAKQVSLFPILPSVSWNFSF